MTRVFARPFAAVALVAALSFATVPSASAGSAIPPKSIDSPQLGWLSTAWAWIGDFLVPNYSLNVPKRRPQATENTEVVREVGRTGSCVDPYGTPLPEFLCSKG